MAQQRPVSVQIALKFDNRQLLPFGQVQLTSYWAFVTKQHKTVEVKMDAKFTLSLEIKVKTFCLSHRLEVSKIFSKTINFDKRIFKLITNSIPEYHSRFPVCCIPKKFYSIHIPSIFKHLIKYCQIYFIR